MINNVDNYHAYVRASAMQLGKAHCKARPILLKIAQNLEDLSIFKQDLVHSL
jgi:hypothetical protein